MDVFKIRKTFAFVNAIGVLRPLALLGLAVVVAMTPVLEMSEWGPIVIAAAVAWTGYELYRSYNILSFEVALSDSQIRVRNSTKSWSEISNAQIKKAHGMSPHIVLHSENGEQLDIPAALENVAYVATVVEKNVANVAKAA